MAAQKGTYARLITDIQALMQVMQPTSGIFNVDIQSFRLILAVLQWYKPSHLYILSCARVWAVIMVLMQG